MCATNFLGVFSPPPTRTKRPEQAQILPLKPLWSFLVSAILWVGKEIFATNLTIPARGSAWGNKMLTFHIPSMRSLQFPLGGLNSHEPLPVHTRSIQPYDR